MVVVVVDNIHGYSIIIIDIHKLHEYPLFYAPLISIAIDPHKKHQLPAVKKKLPDRAADRSHSPFRPASGP